MFNKIIILLLVLAAAAALFMTANNVVSSSSKMTVEEQTEFLKRGIDDLNKLLKQERIAKLNDEMEAQRLLQTEWEAYSKKIMEVEAHEKVIESIEKRIIEIKAKIDQLKPQAAVKSEKKL